MKNQINQAGLTLVELMAVIIVGAILLSTGIPAFVNTIGNSSSKMEANRALVDIQMARSEAVKRGKNVFICNADVEACDPVNPGTCVCGGDGLSFRYDLGWLVFVDEDKNEDFDADTETLLFVGLPPEDVVSMRSNGTIKDGIGLKANGQFSKGSQAGKIAVCYDNQSTDGSLGRKVIINVSGRTEVVAMEEGESCDPGEA